MEPRHHFRHTHHHHNPCSDDYSPPGGPPPPPPPPFYAPPSPPPPPSSYYNVDQYNRALPPSSSVQHVSHVTVTHDRHFHPPRLASLVHHLSHTLDALSDFWNKPTYRIYCKAENNYSLTVREGSVVLARSDGSDPYQHWYKDEKMSTIVKDEEGFPSFALINKATREALKHAIGATQPVKLIPYNPDVLEESVLWTESRYLGDGYRAIRMVNNIRLNVDAFNGDSGVHDGTTIVLWGWKEGDNQRWKIVPY
ncbi:hypothetical protein RJ641_012859, partial [Dillenia turbinata]